MKVLCGNVKEEFISTKLKDFYNQKGITIKYEVLYMKKENGLAE